MKIAFWAAAALLALGNTAVAAEAGDWIVRAGPYTVNPKSDNGDVVSVDDGVGLGFNFTYRFTPNWALEVLAAAPFSHDIELAANGVKVGETQHLPPTVSLQYHFTTSGAFHPYVGAGLNYTVFFDDKAVGPLAGSELSLDDSFGLAAQIGVDFDLTDDWLLNFDIRYIDIDTDATLDGAALTSAEIDPFVAGITLGRRF